MPTKMIFLTSGSTFTVPTDFVSLISVECIGEGGSGGLAANQAVTWGGGGGAYAKIVTLAGIMVGTVYSTQIGAGATGNSTWFGSTSTILADNGRTAPMNTPGAGGSASSSVGYIRFSGGSGGFPGFSSNPDTTYGGGGGGAAGPNGSGINGKGSSLSAFPASNYGGGGDNGYGGLPGYAASANGGNGSEYAPSYGSGGGGAGIIQLAVPHSIAAIGGNGGLYGAGGGGSQGGYSGPSVPGGAGAGGLIVFTYISSNSSSSSSSSGMSSSSSSGGGSGSGGNPSNSSGWVPTSPSRQCIRLAEPQDTTIEQVSGLALTVYANVPYGLLYQNAPYFPVSGPDVLSMWSLDPQGNSATLSINCTLYMSDNGYVFISNDNGKQYLVASINAPFFDANATVINTRNQAILANPVMPCANADRYDYPALLPNQAIPNTFYRDGVLLGSSSGLQTIIG